MATTDSVKPACIEADWPAPARVHAFTTIRSGGVSQGPYASFNLADHVKDDSEHVTQNRARLRAQFDLPAEPLWLSQVHGNSVVQATSGVQSTPEADAAWTTETGVVCAVLTADCLPVLFCSGDGSRVAAAHGGWRGLHRGILSATFNAMQTAAESCLVWLGPAIGAQAFEVGAEVRQAFTEKHPDNVAAFVQTDAEHWLCDMYRLARIELQQLGVTHIYGGGLCTYNDAERFYSYRRDGDTGRMASLIWRNSE